MRPDSDAHNNQHHQRQNHQEGFEGLDQLQEKLRAPRIVRKEALLAFFLLRWAC